MKKGEEIMPKLPKCASGGASGFSFKYSMPGVFALPKTGKTQYKLKELAKLPGNCDPHSLCVLDKVEYEKSYMKGCHPYYLLVGVNTSLTRVCTIVCNAEYDLKTALVSPDIFEYFRNDPCVTIEPCLSFLYRPIPVARKAIIQPVSFNEIYSFPALRKPQYTEKGRRIVLPGDIMYIPIKEQGKSRWYKPPNTYVYKVLSVEYEGVGKKSVIEHALANKKFSQAGYFIDNTTEIIESPHPAHEFINYFCIKFAHGLSSPELPVWDNVKCISEAMNSIQKFCSEQLGIGKMLVKFTINGGAEEDKGLIVNLLAEKLSLRVQERDLSFSLTISEVAEALAGDLEQAAPTLIWIKNAHSIKTVLAATLENQKFPEKHLQSEMLSVLKSQYNDLSNKLTKPLVIVYTSTNSEELLASISEHSVTLSAPSKNDKLYLLQAFCKQICPADKITSLAEQLTNTGIDDIYQIVQNAAAASKAQNTRDFLSYAVLEAKKFHEVKSQEIGHFSGIPNVTWDDVGGLEVVKKEIKTAINLKLKNIESNPLPTQKSSKSGILLWGPPGVGKTLIAKAVAHDWAFTFISVKGPELLNMYVGESEKNIREIFSKARANSPAVLFFDEIDSLAPARGYTSDSSQVMDRVVAQLLTELDGAVGLRNVIVIAATNRPDLLDPALLRPGRFDKVIFVDVARSKAEKLKIIRALTRKFVLDKEVDLEKIVEATKEGTTGADMYGICSNAYMNAVQRLIELNKFDEESLEVTQEDFINAVQHLKPSLSEDQLLEYEKLKVKLMSGA